ncbi:hypothetical protein GCM10011390_40090 [Aureimonas endophytica]|uniref:BrnT family toxin n=1 Tax=Aureimonas endophytica TaxID=2027858 RepID=A0A917EBD7_9HYPH|nr:BrnT family toxin [Aureimonas endophytica]GGE16969.1 hypothetical protein GCM10011390_40090 [Aureimonas endophytica]
MRIVWDEPKRRSNLAKHGLDFAALNDEFFAGALIRPGHGNRFLAIGRLDHILVVAAVFRPLGSEAISIVSMRPASHLERRLYDRQED